jgi:hypothetical protein
VEKEKKRRQERKNRDAFRDLMNEHKAAGELSAKTKWKDYLEKARVPGPLLDGFCDLPDPPIAWKDH